MAQQLPPLFAGDKDLAQVLRDYVATVRAETGLNAVIHVRGERQVPRVVKEGVCCIVRETLVNVVEHAHAARVAIAINYADDGISLRVVDDGQGFQMRQPLDPAWRGLLKMTECAKALGGDLTIQSNIGEGTTVSAILTFQAIEPCL